MPLLPTKEIAERKREKTMLVLRFLRTTIYSTAELLGMVMRLRDRSHAYMTLKALERAKLIQSAKSDIVGRKTLWGITLAGQRFCLQDGDEENTKFFNPAKISSSTLEHYLAIQRVHIALEKEAWKAFEYPDKTPRPHLKGGNLAPENQYTIRPDLLATNPDAIRGAIEVERFVKSERRYEEHVIPGHVRKLNAHEYDFVLWIARDIDHQQTLENTIRKVVQKLRENQRFYLEARPTHYKIFQFSNLQSWGE
jgi:hypothetical protein